MPRLTDEERARLLNLLHNKKSLGREWLEKLFPPLPEGEIFWEGKQAARTKVQKIIASVTREEANTLELGAHGVESNRCADYAAEAARQSTSKAEVSRQSDCETEASRKSASKAEAMSLNDGDERDSKENNCSPWDALLLQGDNQISLHHLMKHSACFGLSPTPFAFIYMDPPFFSELDFHARVPRAQRVLANHTKADAPVFAYSDTWAGGKSEYLSMLLTRIMLMRELLSDTGVLCVHCDWRAAPGVRYILDECFGAENFVNEIVWHYTGGGRSKRYFSRKHDSLFVYAKGKEWTFNVDAIRVPYKKTSGYAKSGIVSKAGKRYLPHPQGTPLDDVWDIPMVNPMAKERVAYATQKPLPLLERLIKAFTHEGDIVGDFFCGSGTTLAAGVALGRRCIGGDFGEQAISVTKQRLLDMGLHCTPQEIVPPLSCQIFTRPL